MGDAAAAFVPDSSPHERSPVNEAEERAARRQAPPSDERLMLEFGQGSQRAFEQLFLRYKQPLFGFFLRRVVDPAQAEELTQECFLAVIRGASRYQPSALFRTYLYSIGLKILRAHRRKTAFRAMFFGVRGESDEPVVSEGSEAAVVLRQAIGKLEAKDREVLLLREFEELDYAEIAQVLRLPINTVRTRLFRARMALRAVLTATAPGINQQRVQQSVHAVKEGA